MSYVIVPNYIRDAIYAKVDEAIAKCPDAAPDREFFYSRLLGYFDEHGEIPEFDLKAKVLSSHEYVYGGSSGKT